MFDVRNALRAAKWHANQAGKRGDLDMMLALVRWQMAMVRR